MSFKETTLICKACPDFDDCKKAIDNAEGIRKYKKRKNNFKYFTSLSMMKQKNIVEKINDEIEDIKKNIDRVLDKQNKLSKMVKTMVGDVNNEKTKKD